MPALHDPDSRECARLSPLRADSPPPCAPAAPAFFRRGTAGARRPVGTARQVGHGAGPGPPGPCRSPPRVSAMGSLSPEGGAKPFASGWGGEGGGGGVVVS